MDRAPTELEQVFLAHRAELLAFFRSRNLGPAAEDLLHELWLRLPGQAGDGRAPLSYLYRMAHNLVIDLRRKQYADIRRDEAWNSSLRVSTADVCEQPLPDRAIAARELTRQVLAALEQEGRRVARIFIRHRIDGATQRRIADEEGISVSTVEGDLRRAVRILMKFREREDED